MTSKRSRQRQGISKYLRRLLLLVVLISLDAGCSTFAEKENTGVVIARRAQVRSSTAVVAADLLEVSRGDRVDILDADTAENSERWLHVRAYDPERTEGWIEARYIMPQEILDRSRKLAEEDKGTPTQATGQLRASANLRLSADRSTSDNIAMKLENGARFEIVGWKRVPKPKSSEATDSDDVPKMGAARQGARRERSGDAPKVPEESVELWYKVRLSPAGDKQGNTYSPAPAGWVYGKQVELTVPSDIIFYRTAREFVAWQPLDETQKPSSSASNSEDAAQDAQPSSWVVLEKRNSDIAAKSDEPEFDRIFVLGYNRDKQEHYVAYRSPDFYGRLPLRVKRDDGDKTFEVGVQNESGQTEEMQFKVSTTSEGLLKVQPVGEIPRAKAKRS